MNRAKIIEDSPKAASGEFLNSTGKNLVRGKNMRTSLIPGLKTAPEPVYVDCEPFLTKEEVGNRLRKPVRTIEDWMRRRIIPFYKVGQAVRFRWSEVQAHFAARYRVAAEEQAATTPSSNANSHA